MKYHNKKLFLSYFSHEVPKTKCQITTLAIIIQKTENNKWNVMNIFFKGNLKIKSVLYSHCPELLQNIFSI